MDGTAVYIHYNVISVAPVLMQHLDTSYFFAFSQVWLPTVHEVLHAD